MIPLMEIIQFALPCWLINMSLNLIYIAKIYFPKLALADQPLDGNKNAFDGRRLLGNSTTILGIGVALSAGVIIQTLIVGPKWPAIVLGVILGLSVYAGHALGSFIKRRVGYADGQYMPFVDHGDYIILTGIVFGFMNQFSWAVIGMGIFLTYVVHPIVTYLAYKVKWHKYPA